MAGVCPSRRFNFSKLIWRTPPYTQLFDASFQLVIGEYYRLIRKFWLLMLISHPVNLYLLRYANRLVMVLLCLLSTNSLDWASIALRGPNYLWPSSTIMGLEWRPIYNPTSISSIENKYREWYSLRRCRSSDRDFCERLTAEWRYWGPMTPTPILLWDF